MLLLCLSLLLAFSFISYLFPNLLFPEVYLAAGLPSSMLGVLLALFPIGSLITSYYLGLEMHRLDRRRVIKLGGLGLGLSMFLFAISNGKFGCIVFASLARIG